MNCPHFNHKTSCDLSGVFQGMIASVSLLDSQIYEIQEVWTGWEDLWYASDVLNTSPKGLAFLLCITIGIT